MSEPIQYGKIFFKQINKMTHAPGVYYKKVK